MGRCRVLCCALLCVPKLHRWCSFGHCVASLRGREDGEGVPLVSMAQKEKPTLVLCGEPPVGGGCTSDTAPPHPQAASGSDIHFIYDFFCRFCAFTFLAWLGDLSVSSFPPQPLISRPPSNGSCPGKVCAAESCMSFAHVGFFRTIIGL